MTAREDETDPETLDRLMGARWSCRAFRPDPVPRATLAAILATAQKTASWNNVQPWQVVLTSGAATERLRALLLERAGAEAAAAPHIPFPEAYEGVYRDRRRACGYQLYEAVGIAREDRAARARQSLRNFALFDAPHTALVTSPAKLGTYGVLDCGAFVSNLMLAAQARGVGSIAQGALATQAEALAEAFDLGDDRHFVCGVALGWPDPDHPVNAYRTPRADPTEVIRWVD